MSSDADRPATSAATAPASAGAWERLVGSRAAVRALLALVVVAGLGVRLGHTGVGLPYVHNWDEPLIAGRSIRMLQTGDLNPHWFHYGSLTIYLNAGVDALHAAWLRHLPESDPEHVDSIRDVRTQFDTGFQWTISHPSFYRWDRVLTALLGAASIALTWIVGRRVAGPWGGLAAALLLAGTAYHVEHSALITANVPASFLVLVVLALTLAWRERGQPWLLVLALLVTGLAASAKYNAACVGIAPLLALVFARRERSAAHRGWLWLAVPLAPALGFLIGTPYALLDASTFLDHLRIEAYHYRVKGHPAGGPFLAPTDHTIEPGLTHLLFQLARFREHLGLPVLIVAALGVPLLAARRAGWILLAFPLVFLPLMTSTRVDFHRNYVPFYPLIAIAFACGLARLIRLVRLRVSPAAAQGAAGIASVLLCWPLLLAAADARAAAASRETRSRAVDVVNALARERGWSRVGVVTGLRMHEQDLGRLAVDHVEAVPERLAKLAPTLDAIVGPLRFAEPQGATPEIVESVRERNAALPRGPVFAEVGDRPMVTETWWMDPGVRISSY